MKDRVHFFGNYEYEREPQTFSHSSPYPSFNFDLTGHAHGEQGLARGSTSSSRRRTRLTVRGNKSIVDMPYDAALHRRRDPPSRRRRSRPTGTAATSASR